MTAPVVHERTSAHTPTFGSLFRSELLRIWSRRFSRWAVIGVLLLMCLVAVVVFRNTAAVSNADILRAQQFCSSGSDSSETFTGPEGEQGSRSLPAPTTQVTAECDTLAELVERGSFRGTDPPAVPSEFPDWIATVGLIVALLAFIFGCTFGGADWSNRTMPALLFWETRRARVFGAKLLALGVAVVAVFALLSLAWFAVMSLIISTHGSWDDGATGMGGDLVNAVATSIVLCAVAGLIGFALANLTRNTGAALGVAFVYFVIVEQVLGFVAPWLLRWLFTVNLGALLTPGGEAYERSNGTITHISQFAGGGLMLLYAVVLCGAAMELFRRRDVT